MSYFLCAFEGALSRSAKSSQVVKQALWLHTSSTWSKKASRKMTKPRTTPSRTRLVKDLKSRSTSSKYEVAAAQYKADSKSIFSRDTVPHIGVERKIERASTFRRKRVNLDTIGTHKSRWDLELQRSTQISWNAPSDGLRHRQSTRSSRERSDNTNHQSLKLESAKKQEAVAPVINEFVEPPSSISPRSLPTKFTSPPLIPGLLSCLKDTLGSDATPTPIQGLSLKWLFHGIAFKQETGANSLNSRVETQSDGNREWKQFLLASETGSGKSIAYLLPVLQALKQSELKPSSPVTIPQPSRLTLNPRAVILAPTHELSRQLTSFAKALIHGIKLRILCASRANVRNPKPTGSTASKMAEQFEAELRRNNSAELQLQKVTESHPVDLIVGTPTKLLDMARGRGWDRKEHETVEEELGHPGMQGRDRLPGFRRGLGEPEMGLANVEWVVVDEADILFDPDFQETTRLLLADISAARGCPVPFTPEPILAGGGTSQPTKPSTNAVNYPFNLILTCATIPSALAAYLDQYHPSLIRLASPNLHHLPKTLQIEYVGWTGGNKNADIERRIRKVWAEESVNRSNPGQQKPSFSKVLVFCNKSSKVEELGRYLTEKGINTIALTSTSASRKRGSNHHLDGFLRKFALKETSSDDTSNMSKDTPRPATNPAEVPHVMITTSLLSRGLDFSPDIRHVFIVDEPRNMVDFLHRAGRSGRAGERGKVVVFGKMKGRGSAQTKEMRKRVGALVA